MFLAGTWNNNTTLLEKEDYAYLLCALGGCGRIHGVHDLVGRRHPRRCPGAPDRLHGDRHH